MAFSKAEKEKLLTINGIGNTVIQRFEQIGIDSLLALSKTNTEDVIYQIASMLKVSCWKNSPQARAAVNDAIRFAKIYCNDKSANLK